MNREELELISELIAQRTMLVNFLMKNDLVAEYREYENEVKAALGPPMFDNEKEKTDENI